MQTIQMLILIMCVAIFIPIFIYSLRTTKAFRTHRLLIDGRAGCCEEIGFVGFSAICSGVSSMERVQELLSVEYSRYEVIVVLDGERYRPQIEQIISHYKLVRMNTVESITPNVVPKAIYRSCQRNFRRLVLIDVAYGGEYSDYNCGAAVASYDFLLPLGPSSHLYSSAIEALAIAISEQETRCDLFHLDRANPFYLFRRDRLVAAGGFSEDIVYNPIFERECVIYTPTLYQESGRRENVMWSMMLSGVFIVLLINLLWYFIGRMTALIAGLTLVAIWSLATYEYELYGRTKSLKATMLCYIRYLLSFFYRRKFYLS